MKRLFFALWPDSTTRQQISNLAGKLAQQGQPISASNLHVTLLFLGDTSVDQQKVIANDAGKIYVPPMRLTFDQLSFWKKPAVLCLTSSNFSESVSLLAQQLSSIAKQNGVTFDERPLKPHVTLCRKVRSAAYLDFDPIHWQTDSFCLVESCAVVSGREYRVIEHWGAPASDK
jgi:2'-5' RNA ligase